ncbi:glycosyltransferase family 39 protein [Limnospira indica]|nr:glycosyltransferase family 39 protein [Limnospira indica]
MSNTSGVIPPLKKGDRISPKWIIATVLFFLTILTRLPFHTQFPQGDEGHFAMAVLEFDVSKTQPQMPGMFIIFIWMARFFHLFLDDPTLSLVAVNIVASGVTVAALYLLAKSWYNHQVGLSVALLTLTSPLFWYHSVTAFSHTL